MAPQALQCTSVSPACPVEASIYGYYPSLGANAFFCAFFALFFLLNLGLGFRYRTWTFMIALGLGCLAEGLGYVGRILLHSNPFSSVGFEIQICCLIMAPAFVSAAIYLTLKHITLCFGPECSKLQPRYYTWIFITADLLSLVLQGAGGGIAATANDNDGLRNTGTDLMMAGIVWQVITLLVFAAMVGDYAVRLWRSGKPLSLEAEATKKTTSFQLFIAALMIAFLTVFARCVYRIAEMAGGWSNPIMQNEPEFIALDSCMITVATLMLTVFHPGFCFPRLSRTFGLSSDHMEEKQLSEESVA